VIVEIPKGGWGNRAEALDAIALARQAFRAGAPAR
jgi:hypothetical protein